MDYPVRFRLYAPVCHDAVLHLLGPGAGHGEELAVDVPPAGEQAVGGQEEEEVLPPQPQLVLVQHLGGNVRMCSAMFYMFAILTTLNNFFFSKIFQ